MADKDRILTAFALPDLGVVEAMGPDAGTFLDRLLSADISGIESGSSVPSCLLDANGFLIATMDVHRSGEDTYLLTAPGGRAAELHGALDRFLLMDELTLTLQPSTWVGLTGDGAREYGFNRPLPRC